MTKNNIEGHAVIYEPWLTPDTYKLASPYTHVRNRVPNRNHWWQIWKPQYRMEFISQTEQRAADGVTPSPEKGRVVKVTAPPVYDPEVKRKGGRMVKRMPRQLQKIKQGQETPRDE